MKTSLFLLSVSVAAIALPAAAQRLSTNNVDNAPPITVEGIPYGPESPKATSNPRISGKFQIESSAAYSRADIFVRCAKPGAKSLHDIVEGPPNYSATAFKQGIYAMQRAGCRLGEGVSVTSGNPVDKARGSMEANTINDTTGMAQGFYDRGAMIEYAIRNYAADVQVTRQDTHSEQIVNRFIAVEQGRNRYRWPEDLAYFKIAACMVQAQPELAGKLAASPVGSAPASRISDAIIAKAHLCVPRARRVEVDPTQFRIYVMDAYYRWAEATKGVDSLIPAADEAP